MQRLPLYAHDGGPTPLAVETAEPLERDANCTRCPLSARAPIPRTVCIAADGEPGGVLVVGEAPGRNEDASGRPFVGDSGALLRRLVKQWWKGPVAFDNAIRCYPGKAGPTDKAAAKCRGFLTQTLAEASPTRVVTVGAWAAYSVTGRSVSPFSTRRGYGYLNNRGNPIPVFFVIHPAAALRNRFVRKWFETDLHWALTAAPPPPGPWTTLVEQVETVEDAEKVFEELRGQAWVAFDVETCGIMWTPEFEIISVALCGSDSETPYVWQGEALRDEAIRAPLFRLLTSSKVQKVGQNVKYDQLAFRARYDICVRPIHGDTRLQRKLIEPEAEGKLAKMAELVGMGGLKEEAEDAMSTIVAKVKRTLKKLEPDEDLIVPGVDIPREVDAAMRMGVAPEKYMYRLLPTETLVRYNARDAVATARLERYLEDAIADEPALERTWDTLIRPAAVALERVEGWGIACDREAIQQFDRYLETREIPLKQQLDSYGDVNWDSPVQVADLFFRKLALSPPKLTKTGRPSTDAEVLKELRAQHPIAGTLLDYRMVTKLRGTYAGGMFPHVREDGRIHPNIKLDGARSGRTSCIRRGTLVEVVRDVSKQPKGVPIEDVRQGDLAYAYLDGRLVLRPVTWAGKVGRKALVRVSWLGTGRKTRGYVDLTPDHRVLRTDGTWVEAQHLNPGDRIYSLSRNETCGYARLFPTGAPPIDREHRFIYQQVHGELPEEVHHDNENKLDNRVLNLKGTTSIEHRRHHGQNPSAALRRKRRAWARENVGKRGGFGCVAPGEQNPAWLGLTLEEVQQALEAARWSLVKAARRLGHDFITFRGYVVRAGYDVAAVKACGMALRNGRDVPRPQPHNHSVTSVEWLGEEDDVYDLTVDEAHNFIAGELCVHNCTDPNLQNIPRAQSVEGKMARDIFVAPPGYVLLECDYSQLELRVAAMLSGDKKMQAIFDEGVDYHLRTAQLVSQLAWGIAPDKVEDKHRSQAKAVNFGVLYGKTANTLAEEWGISKAKAQAIVDAIMGNFKDLQKWCAERQREANRTGFVWTWWDGKPARRRPLYRVADQDKESDKARSVAEHGAINSPIQGTASDFCIASLAEVVQWIEEDDVPGVKLCLAVHDALLLEVREDMLAETYHTVTDIMCSWPSNGVPLVADAKAGRAWGSMEKYHPEKQKAA